MTSCARLREIARDRARLNSDTFGLITALDAHIELCLLSEFHGVGRLQSRVLSLVARRAMSGEGPQGVPPPSLGCFFVLTDLPV